VPWYLLQYHFGVAFHKEFPVLNLLNVVDINSGQLLEYPPNQGLSAHNNLSVTAMSILLFQLQLHDAWLYLEFSYCELHFA
jgi:hypothetical protein